MTKTRLAARWTPPIFLIPIALFPAAPAHADETDMVIVSALRAPSLSSDVGSSVTVITGADLEAGQYAFAADAIARAPGVTLARNGGAGAASSIRLRGSASGQSLIVIDGVVVNDAAAPQGGYNFGALDVADIERIEILRGPQSLLYGADAIGGVIAVTTRRNHNGMNAFLEGGSLGTLRGGATIGAGADADFGRLTISGITTGGVSRASAGSEKDGFRALTASLAGGVRLNDVWRVETTARVNDSRADIDGFPPPLFALGDTSEIENTQEIAVSGRALHEEGALNGAFSIGYSTLKRNNSDGGTGTFLARGRRLNLDYLGVYQISDRLRLFAGAEIERARAIVSGVDDAATQGGLFLMAEAKPADWATLSAGLRRDEFSGVKGATTARFAAALRPGAQTILRASVGTGFRAPSLFERYYDQFGVTPNPDLRPERARGADIGIEQRFGAEGRHHVAVTLFHLNVRDQIDFDLARFGYFNIDEARSRGIESELGLQLTDWAGLTANYTLTDAIDKGTGARLLRVPEHKGEARIDLQPTSRLLLSASVLMNGREADSPAANESFARLDLRAAYAFSDRLELYGRIENATDAAYEDVSGYGEPGAAVYAGVRARL